MQQGRKAVGVADDLDDLVEDIDLKFEIFYPVLFRRGRGFRGLRRYGFLLSGHR